MLKKKKQKIDGQSVYCGLFKCPHTQCLRHHVHEPWNTIIIERIFNPDKDWNCKDKLEE